MLTYKYTQTNQQDEYIISYTEKTYVHTSYLYKR